MFVHNRLTSTCILSISTTSQICSESLLKLISSYLVHTTRITLQISIKIHLFSWVILLTNNSNGSPHYRHRTDRSIVFARRRKCASLSNTWFLGPARVRLPLNSISIGLSVFAEPMVVSNKGINHATYDVWSNNSHLALLNCSACRRCGLKCLLQAIQSPLSRQWDERTQHRAVSRWLWLCASLHVGLAVMNVR